MFDPILENGLLYIGGRLKYLFFCYGLRAWYRQNWGSWTHKREGQRVERQNDQQCPLTTGEKTQEGGDTIKNTNTCSFYPKIIILPSYCNFTLLRKGLQGRQLLLNRLFIIQHVSFEQSCWGSRCGIHVSFTLIGRGVMRQHISATPPPLLFIHIAGPLPTTDNLNPNHRPH